MIEPKEENSSKKRNKWIVGLLFLLIFGLTTVLVLYILPFKTTNIEHTEFEELTDVPFVVMDSNYFEDEDLEKWYMEKRQKPGEYLYQNDDTTYILLSLGVVKDDSTFLLLNGVKENAKGDLVVGYDTLKVEEAPELKLEDDIRSTIISVEGKYEDLQSVKVNEDK